MRRREAVAQKRQPWVETVEEFGARLREICDHSNTHFDVEGLCEGLPSRVQKAIDADGDRIKSDWCTMF